MCARAASSPRAGTPAAPGGWAVYTGSYTATNAQTGSPITIDLLNNGHGPQADFDNVVLSKVVPSTTTNDVPEPASMALLSMGAMALGLTRRRKR